jgi:hypothetical protein
MTEPDPTRAPVLNTGGQVGLAAVGIAPGHLLVVDRADARAQEHPVGEHAGGDQEGVALKALAAGAACCGCSP